ncbi:MAG: lipid-A-disaccharide synthase [Gammaproteobacteria bacterium]|nr:lipid-A-disaccharide synthase [Gammaproteobacteria bacterium]NCF59451.1 lipid-A-disaccharide synthase [Gammaproteobacteria bacterium]
MPLRVGLVAGESSGDLLGAGLIAAVRRRIPDAVFEGVAGPEMVATGCERWADAEELAVMGVVEPLKHLPRLLRLRRSLIARWRETPPDVFVGIDAPDFNLGLEAALKTSGIRTIHYVSPSIWAWRAGRIHKIRRAADRVICILPFEPAIYAEQGMDAVFVGHPKADALSPSADVTVVRRELALPMEARIIAMLPGSRSSEVTQLAPVFAATAATIAAREQDVHFVTPVAAPKLRPVIEASLRQHAVADRFTIIDGRSIEAMSASDFVLLASGTAALESALLGKPTVAAYRVSALTALITKVFRLVKVKHFTLPNLLTGESLIPEFIQGDADPARIAGAVMDLLDDPERCAVIKARFAKLRTELAMNSNERAADALISLTAQG